jgi:nucleoside-diphosphate-sugar epimerase
LHIAASLNRKSEKACLNSNLRGTLNVVQLARDIERGRGGLARFSHVSTVAVCGKRNREDVTEDTAIDWDRSDYDPYGRTKKFCEHMVRELLPDVRKTFFRPSIVMGDSRHPRTTQFDMVRAFCVLADMPFLPMRKDARLDIVNADFVGRAIADLHVKREPRWDTYHLSSGTASMNAGQIGGALLSRHPDRRPPRFVPMAERPFAAVVDRMADLPKSQLALVGSLLKVFLPYITFDTVFRNERVCEELGETPVPFTEYCGDLYSWAKSVNFQFPAAPLPAGMATELSRATGNTTWV